MKFDSKGMYLVDLLRRHPYMLVAAVAWALGGITQTTRVDAALQLAHWSLDDGTYNVTNGTVDDVAVSDIGNNQIQEIGSGVMMGVPGIVGTGAYFDGKYYSAGGGGSDNVYLKAPTDQLYGPGRDNLDGMESLSLTAWVLPTEVGFMNSLGGERDVIRIDNSVFADPVYFLRFVDMGGSTISLEFAVTNDTGGYQTVKAVLPGIPRDDFFDGCWHMAAGVYDGESMQLYWDGNPLGDSVAMNGRVQLVNDHVLEIGNFPFAESWEPFRGSIDEVKVYGGVLTSEEIESEYKLLIPEPTSLVLLALGALPFLRRLTHIKET